MNVSELLILITGTIGALAAAVVAIMNGIATRNKLDAISRDTNGNLSALKAELALERHVRIVQQGQAISQPLKPKG